MARSDYWIDQVPSRQPERAAFTSNELAIINAHGKAITLLLSALEARGDVDVARFAQTLSNFAFIVAEDDAREATILAAWAELMRDSVGARANR